MIPDKNVCTWNSANESCLAYQAIRSHRGPRNWAICSQGKPFIEAADTAKNSKSLAMPRQEYVNHPCGSTCVGFTANEHRCSCFQTKLVNLLCPLQNVFHSEFFARCLCYTFIEHIRANETYELHLGDKLQQSTDEELGQVFLCRLFLFVKY